MENIKHKLCVQCMTFNHAKFITQTLDGFCMQETSFPYICCVIDDASTDRAQSVILDYVKENFKIDDKYSDIQDTQIAKIIYTRHRDNMNCFFLVVLLKENLYSDPDGYKKKQALIAPWREKCEYEALCEGDDYWIDNTKLQAQVTFLDEHPEYSVCSHRIKKYDQDENVFYVDRLKSMFGNKEGVTFDNRSRVWISETSSIVYHISAQEEFRKSPCQKRDNVHLYYLLKKGKGYCISKAMSVYRQHFGGVFAKQDLNTKLVNGGYKALQELFEYEKTSDARFLYYRSYALAFLLTKGKILFVERFSISKFLTLPYFIYTIVVGIHPIYKKENT